MADAARPLPPEVGGFLDLFDEAALVLDATGRISALNPAARALLSELLRPGDVVLVKASRSCGLERLAEDLLGADA